MKYLSLFSGIGGFELGINQAYESSCNADGSQKRGIKKNQTDDKRQRLQSETWEDSCAKKRPTSECSPNEPDQRPLCIGYSEIDKYAVSIYQKHFNHHNYGDITKINADELPDFDLLVGGFPCQSFSIAGKRGGFSDTRGTLFFEIARILETKQPRLVLLENVKGLLSHDVGKTFKTIISTLDELGYDLQWQVLNSKNFGVPQNRERVFIVGHLRGTPRPEVFPIIGSNKKTKNLVYAQKADKEIARIYSPEGLAPTIHLKTGGWQEPKISSDKLLSVRRLTPLECERLQGFPDNWTKGISDTQRYKCCGNAVTVNVIQAIMERLLK